MAPKGGAWMPTTPRTKRGKAKLTRAEQSKAKE